MEEKELQLREEWKRYVESYENQSMKKAHLLSCTHVVFKLLEKAFATHKETNENS